MPSIIHAEPLPPGIDRSLDASLAFGKQQWQTAWRVFSRQWTQPALIRLAMETLDCRALHSSQIAGFQNGSLRDPSPKLLLAIGLLNEALARSNGHLSTEGLRCPGAREELWRHKDHLKNPDGSVMGPADVFNAVAGLVDLGMDTSHQIPIDCEEAVSKGVGRFLRLSLAKRGEDWLEKLPELSQGCPAIADLLMGREVEGDRLVASLPALAEIADLTVEDLWGIAVEPAIESGK